MLLQTRIILFVVATVATVAALLLGMAGLREDAADRHARDLELARLETAWQLAVADAAAQADQGLGRIAADPEVAQALASGARGALARRLEALPSGLTDLNLFAGNGDLLYSSDLAPEPAPLVGRAPLDALLAGQRLPGGVRLAGGRLVVVSGVPVYTGSNVSGAAVAGIGLPSALDALRRNAGGRVFAVDRDGAPIGGQIDPLWSVVHPLVQPAARAVTDFADAGHRYALASLPVADLAGGRAATVLVASDVTRAAEERALWTAGYAAAIALVLLTALALLLAYLRSSFATLDVAVKALLDLSQGRSTGYVELPAGNDEIGRIARAVEVFRGVMRDIERAAGQRDRRLRRQQRFIRRQMEALASTLEEEARTALLDDLRQIEMETHDTDTAQSKAVNDELGLLALGFSRLATRVGTQQVQLVQLVRDLREALEDKRRLITLQQELEIARTMQLTILPQVFPELPQLDIAARMQPAKEVGGDFYDFFPISEDRVAVTIADVSGKGIPAAFFMLITRTMLRAIAESGVGPAETMRRVNNLLAAENEQSMFVTVFYGELDLRTGVLTYSNGGHNPPLRIDRAGTVTVLENTPGIALAAMPDMPFGERVITLAEGDSVLLFTDGVTEAFDADGGMFGDERLVATMAALDPGLGALKRLDGVLDQLHRFVAGAPQSDDITGLVIRWRGVAPAAENPVCGAAAMV
ncbi:PP2C family protein-serine/threonine phosphatase [Azospirillum sp.]|uniref:PP2C family protein-serine/threonine phosphatase n=1 Tax=Azospirillum sp. TaxID=34012 RepID=UPI003D727F6C